MASGVGKLIPQEPDKVMVIRKLLPNILICSTPFKRGGYIKIGGRGTVVKLKNDSLAVFSPVALTDIVKASLQEQLGSNDVKYLIAPDQEHHIFLESWHKQWPQAKIVAPETLPDLRDKQGYFKLPAENLVLFKKADKEKGAITVDKTFDEEFDMEYVDSHLNKELVFCHRPTKTLIQADLIFNLPATEQQSRTNDPATSGILTKIFSAINTTKGSAIWQKRLIWYAISSGDRPGFNKSAAKINTWDFDRIVPCHGDVIESGGKGIFEKVMQWHIAASKKAT